MTQTVRARPTAKVTLYDRSSGTALLRWPVDAGELLATGGYTTDPLPLADAPLPVPLAPAATPESLPGLEEDAPAKPRRGRRK